MNHDQTPSAAAVPVGHLAGLKRIATLLVLAAAVLSGCGPCEPTRIALTVELEPTVESLRTLPILASGEIAIGSVAIPDSHGVLEWDSSFTDNRVNSVRVRDLQLGISIAGTAIPVTIVRIEGLDGEMLFEGERLRVWWTIDRSQVQPAALALDEGDEYRATLSFDWSLDTCLHTADGAVATEDQGFVQPSIITTTFEQTGGAVASSGGTASYAAQARIKNGITTDIQEVKAIAIGLGSVPGAVVWNTSVVTVNGLPMSTAAPGDAVEFRGSPLPASGTAPWLLVLYVNHEKTGNPTPERDVLAWLQ